MKIRIAWWLAATIAVLLASPAVAQQFRMERDFDLIRRSAWPHAPGVDTYWVSLPVDPWFDDSADTQSSRSNKCVGDPGGPSWGDGVINSDDVICSWWTAREAPATAGSFTLTWYDPLTCTPVSRTAMFALGSVRFAGLPFVIRTGVGYEVFITVPFGATYSPHNHAVITGDHEETWAGLPIEAAPTCPAGSPGCCAAMAARRGLISVPYHALYRSSDEILCGLEGVDWNDANRDGRPDSCWEDLDADGHFDAGESPTGVFDGRVAITIGEPSKFEMYTPRTVTIQLGQLRFTGTEFALRDGDGYMLYLSRAHAGTIFLPPHE